MATTTTYTPPGGAATAEAGGPGTGGSRWGGANTPTRLWAVLTASALALIVVAVACGAALAVRQADESHALGSSEALAVDVHELYHSLADADAAAATSILAGPVSPAWLATRYATDIQQAENSLASASSALVGDATASPLLAKVSAQLPTYTALIATARANNRLGYPVGAAYLNEASGLLHNTILNEVTAVESHEAGVEAADQSGVSGFPLWPLLAVLAAAVLLYLVFRELNRSTRRRLNVGLSAGVAVTLLLAVWSFAAFVRAGSAADAAQSDFARTNSILQARDDLAKAESDQSLTLIARGEDNGVNATAETAALKAISNSGVLDGEATRLLANLNAKVDSIAAAVSSGDYLHAAAQTTGTGDTQASGTAVYNVDQLDAALVKLYDTSQAQYTSDGGSAVSALDGGLWLGLAVALVAALAAVWGINRRLAEYR